MSISFAPSLISFYIVIPHKKISFLPKKLFDLTNIEKVMVAVA